MTRTTADLRRFDPAQFGSYEELTVDWVDRRVEEIRVEAEVRGNSTLATLMQLELEECVLLAIASCRDGDRAQQLAIAALRAFDLTFLRPYAEIARSLSEPGAIGDDSEDE
jgi:hypothetical protein